jgi:hypothetical protein
MRFRKFIPPMSTNLFLVLTFAGTYFVRLRILEEAMGTRDVGGIRAPGVQGASPASGHAAL